MAYVFSMATLDSSSTTAEISAAYLDNCGYYEDEDAAMARRFVTACEAMLSRGVTAIEQAGQRMQFSTGSLESALGRAKEFISGSSGATGGAQFSSFVDFRR